MHIELDVEGSRIRYDAGDHVAIYPTNDTQIVDRYIDLPEACPAFFSSGVDSIVH